MDDLKVMAASFVAIAAIGVRMEMTPARVAPSKSPVEKVVAAQMLKNIEERAKKTIPAGPAGEANKQKVRAAGGAVDDSTEKALNELESHGEEVTDRLKHLPFAGGDDDEPAEDPPK